MAEEGSAKVTGNRPALEIQVDDRTGHKTLKIDNPWLAAGILGTGVVGLAVFHRANPRLVEFAVRVSLATWAAHVLSTRPSSILVDFVFDREESYQAFMRAYAAGTVKQRLQEEFFKIGYTGELQVTILDDDHAPQPREQNLPESAAQTGFSEGSLSNPPEVDVTLLTPLGLSKRPERQWKDVCRPIDILLLTREECELFSCLSYLNLDYCTNFDPKAGLVFLGEMGDGEAKLKVGVIQRTRDFAPGAIEKPAVAVFEALFALRPRAVICVGCCAGLKEKKVKLGDVIISSKIAIAGGAIESYVLRSPFSPGDLKSAAHGWKAPLKNPNDLQVEVHKDSLLLSSPKVISSDERLMELIERYPDAIAVEMEGKGLYRFPLDYPTRWVIIKGVSHYAGDNKSASDHWRQFSSLMAASLVAHILGNAKVFEKLPHYKKPGT